MRSANMEMDVKTLSGTTGESNNKDVAEQLARINEQLIIKNRRAKLIWKIVGIVLIGIIVFYLLLVVLSYAAFNTYTNVGSGEIILEEVVIEP